MFTVRALSVPEPESAIRICELADERGGEIGGLKLTYRPLEVQARLQSDIFEAWPRVVCTSATLALGSDLSWFQRSVGAVSEKRPTALVRIPSPFDYKSHVLIYTPPGLVPLYEGAAEERYLQKLAAEVRRLVQASRGPGLRALHEQAPGGPALRGGRAGAAVPVPEPGRQDIPP